MTLKPHSTITNPYGYGRSTVTAVIGTVTLWKKHTVCVIAIQLTIVIACTCLLNFCTACSPVVTSIHCQIPINVLEHPLFRNLGYATDSRSAALLSNTTTHIYALVGKVDPNSISFHRRLNKPMYTYQTNDTQF